MFITAAEFKAKCLKLMDQVQSTRVPLVITKRGKPVAQIVPMPDTTVPDPFGCMAGTATETGDITAPLNVEWSATE